MKRGIHILLLIAIILIAITGPAQAQSNPVQAYITADGKSSSTVWICKYDIINLQGSNFKNTTSPADEIYSWVNLSNPDLTSDAQTFSTRDSGRWELTLTTPIGTDKDTVYIQYYPTPNNFYINNNASPVSGCTYENINLSVNPIAGASNYKWYVEFDTTALYAGTSYSFPAGDVPGGLAYYIAIAKYSGVYSGGPFTCPIIDSIQVFTKPTPQVILPTDTAVCEGTALKFAASVVLLPSMDTLKTKAEFNTISFQWNNTGSYSPGANTFTAGATTGVYTYIVSGKNIFSCFTTDDIKIVVNPKPVVNAGSTTTICPGNQVVLSPVVTAAAGPFSYAWSPRASLDDTTLQNPIASPVVSTTYTVFVKDKVTGCKANGSRTINLNLPINLTTLFTDSTKCASDTVILKATASGGTPNYTYSWSPAHDMNDSTSNSPKVYASDATTYSLIATDSRGCSAGTSVNIHELSVSLAGQDSVAQTGDSIKLDAWNQYQKGFSYLWKDSVDNIIGTGRYIWVKTSGKYTVSVYNPLTGCGVSDSRKVTFTETPPPPPPPPAKEVQKIFVPNVFNPAHEDSDNAHLRVYGNNISDHNFLFQIFNQWGEVVYQADTFSEANLSGWNGNLKNSGTSLTMGVYTYTVRGEFVDGSKFEKSGTANLLR